MKANWAGYGGGTGYYQPTNLLKGPMEFQEFLLGLEKPLLIPTKSPFGLGGEGNSKPIKKYFPISTREKKKYF